MSHYSPQSPLDFLSEKEESEEVVDTVSEDQQPESEEIEEEQEEEQEEEEQVETADYNHSSFSAGVEKLSSESKSIMDVDSSSGSSSDNQVVEENATSPGSTVAQEPPFRSVFALKPRDLKMKGISFTPESPANRSFDNAVEEDDCQIQKAKREEGKDQNENRDDEEPRNESKKPLLERLGRDEGKEDSVEIAISKGILDYYSKNEEYPIANSSALTNFVENSLQVQGNVDPLQLTDRISELRERFIKIREKDVSGIGPSDQEAFELAKKIWGSEVKNAGNLIEFDEDKRGSKAGEEEHDLSMYPFLKESLPFVTLNLKDLAPVIVEGMGLIGDSKVKELNEKWKRLKVEEIELFAKRLDLILEQTKLVLETIKSSSLH